MVSYRIRILHGLPDGYSHLRLAAGSEWLDPGIGCQRRLYLTPTLPTAPEHRVLAHTYLSQRPSVAWADISARDMDALVTGFSEALCNMCS